MKWGDLGKLFAGVAWKRLTPHEVDPTVSNGHEFQGVNRLRDVLGTESAERLPTTYMLLKDEADDVETIRSWSKWYDSRANNPERSAEWRLYYPAEAGQIQAQMHDGDLMVLVVTRQRTLLVLMARKGSGRERELQLLFGIDDPEAGGLRMRRFDRSTPVDFLAASIMEELGLARPELPEDGDATIVQRLVDELVREYPDALPPGPTVAALVRSHIPGVDAVSDPDGALMRWIEAEAATYRAWEDRKIGRRLVDGFVDPDGRPDVEAFRRFSMSLRQSRVSRAGGALQYHFRELLDARRIRYVMEPVIDGGERPDFLFPGLREYEDESFPATRLRMVGAKFTAKDRWRQVLAEARRISPKHLLTLDAGISMPQRRLMMAASLILVMPREIRERYTLTVARDTSVLTINEFIHDVAGL